jgi:cysteine desulfurase
MNQVIYLDYAASTPVDKRVCAAMLACLNSSQFANASSPNRLGKQVAELIEQNRTYVAELIHADHQEIIWTSGATESNNLAIIGTVLANRHLGNHVITSKIEHDSVIQAFKYLESLGVKVTYLNLLPDGSIDLEELSESISNKTILVSIMYVNNETGSIQDIPKISNIVKNKNVIFHVDATQAAGKIPIDVAMLSVDLMSLSAHKMYGPKGIGALYINESAQLTLQPSLHGGSQEKRLRPGTLATHQIVGFGEACKIAIHEMEHDLNHVTRLRADFFQDMDQYIQPNLPLGKTIPYIFNIYLSKMDDEIMKQMYQSPRLILSAKSACSNHDKNTHSHVLQALGLNMMQMSRSCRISIGKYTTREEMQKAVNILKKMHQECVL